MVAEDVGVHLDALTKDATDIDNETYINKGLRPITLCINVNGSEASNVI